MSQIIYNTTSSSSNTNTRAISKTSAGTVAVTEDSNVVTGTTTAFLNEVNKNDEIVINGETHIVKSVDTNTVLRTESMFAATVSGQTMTLRRIGLCNKGLNLVTILSHPTNTQNIFVGLTTNAARDGADVTATAKSMPIEPGKASMIMSLADVRHIFVRSAGTSQAFSVIVNN